MAVHAFLVYFYCFCYRKKI